MVLNYFSPPVKSKEASRARVGTGRASPATSPWLRVLASILLAGELFLAPGEKETSREDAPPPHPSQQGRGKTPWTSWLS